MDIHELQQKIAEINRDRGWYDLPRSFGEGIALIHSEVSEALEAYRKGGDPGQLHAHVGEELADVVIRVLDEAERMNVDLERFLERKIAANAKRPYRHGGRKI